MNTPKVDRQTISAMDSTKPDNAHFTDLRKVSYPIPGLLLYKDYIPVESEKALSEMLDAQPWKQERRGLVQNYGYVFNYKAAAIGNFDRVTPIPDFLADIGARLVVDRFFPRAPECIIVNNYEPGQGIVPHIDVIEHFGAQVVTLSLLSPIRMLFMNDEERKDRFEIALPARSLLSINDEARFKWLHGIRARKTDEIDGVIVKRERRISISFRNVKEEYLNHSESELFAKPSDF